MQNMTGLRVAPGPQQTQGGMQRNQGTQQLRDHIFRLIQQQEYPPGWQTTVSLQARSTNVFQLVSSLRLIKADMSVQDSVGVAIGFERKTFFESQDKPSYEEAMDQKLNDIAATRTKQALSMQHHMQNLQPSQLNMPHQQMPMQSVLSNPSQSQFPHGFPNPQLAYPMQPSPIPIQQQPSQQPQYSQSTNPLMGAQLQTQQNQHPSLGMSQQITQGPGQVSLRPEDHQHIHHIAQRLAQNTSEEDRNVIRQKLQNAPPQKQEEWRRQGADPLALWFRNQATHQYLRMRGANIHRHLSGGMAPASGMLAQPPRPMSQNINNHGEPMVAATPPQGFDPSYTGNIQQNVNQIHGVQADALRMQEAGQVVVPASTSQRVSQQQPQRGPTQALPQQQPTGQLGVPRSMQNQTQAKQQFLQAHQLQNEKLQQAARISGQSHQSPRSMSSQGPQQMSLQGQVGGLNNNMGQGPPQQSPAMPNLNRPLQTSNQQSQAQGTPHQRSQPRTVQMSQPQGPEPSMSQQSVQHQPLQMPPQRIPQSSQTIGVQQRPWSMANLPPKMQQRLAAMPENQRANTLAQMRQHAELRQAQQMGARPPVPPGTAPTPGPGMQAGQQAQSSAHNKITQPQGVQNSINIPQNGNVIQQPNSFALANQHVGPIQNNQPLFREVIQNQQPEQRPVMPAASPLTEDQTRNMDRVNYPRAMLSSQVMLTHLPPDAQTWGQLKAWVAQNTNVMAPDVLNKLKGLQAIHYQTLLHQHQQRLRMAQSSNGQSNQQPTVQQPGPAPQARMVVQPSSGQSAGQVPNMAAPAGPPPLQPPSIQEIQTARLRLPDHLRNLSNEQISAFILDNRYKQMQKANQAQVNPDQPLIRAQPPQQTNLQRSQQVQQQPYPGQLPQNILTPQQQQQQQQQQQHQQQQPPPFIRQQPPPPQNGRKQAEPATGRAIPQPQLTRSLPQANNQSQPTIKGIKRNNTDDVIEVPNPNISQHQQHQRAPATNKQAQIAQGSNMPQFSPEQLVAMPQQQRARYEAELRRQASQRGETTSLQQPVQGVNASMHGELARQKLEDDRRKSERLDQISREVLQTLPPRPPVPMEEQTRQRMTQQLQHARQMVQKMEEALPSFYKMSGDEKMTRELISTRVLLVRQYRDAEYNPVDQFTITPEELDTSINKLQRFFHFIMRKMREQRGASINQAPQPSGQNAKNVQNVQNAQAQPQPMTQVQIHQLSKANLVKNDEALKAAREPLIQRNHSNRDSRAPAAPTTSQPPYTFGAQSPSGHGVPQYPPNAVTPDKLKLPPTKKRKNNQAGSAATTPAQALGTPASISSPQVGKVPSPEIQRSTAPTILKCSVPDCEASKNGFATPEELVKHMGEAHRPKEPPIEDPLAWALESIRFGLGVDESGRLLPVEKGPKNGKDIPEAQMMKTSTSMQGQTPMKREISSTPMSRVPTQTGPSKLSNTLKPPQQGSTVVKNPSDTKVYLSKVSKETKPSVIVAREPLTPPHDPWIDASISPADLSSCFPTFSDLQGALSDNSLTPASTLLSSKSDKNSPRPSDISENDDLKIDLDWDWLPLPSAFDDPIGVGTGDDDYGIGMGWEDVFGKEIGHGVNKGIEAKKVEMLGKGKGNNKRGEDEWEASAAFDPNLFSMDLY